ncbi:MAG: hypothetical protein ACREJC_22295, partial [Tepidisphaeraceae bacterium]
MPTPIQLEYESSLVDRRAQARFAIWVACAALLLCGMPAWFWLLRSHLILNHDGVLIGGWLLCVCILLVIGVLLRTTPRSAIRLSARVSFWLIIAGAAFLHGSALLLLRPVMSDDAARYRLEGKMWLEGVSPYTTTPAEFVRSHQQLGDFYDTATT